VTDRRTLTIQGLAMIADHFALQNDLQREFNWRGFPNMHSDFSDTLSQVASQAAEYLSTPTFTPSERQYLLRLLGGSLDGGEGMTALGVLELRNKVEKSA